MGVGLYFMVGVFPELDNDVLEVILGISSTKTQWIWFVRGWVRRERMRRWVVGGGLWVS